MSEEDQIVQFSNDLDKLVERVRDEYEMTYASVVGVLQMKIHLLCSEADNRSDELEL